MESGGSDIAKNRYKPVHPRVHHVRKDFGAATTSYPSISLLLYTVRLQRRIPFAAANPIDPISKTRFSTVAD